MGSSGIDLYPPLAVVLSPTAPVVILNHGLTGGSHESYIRNIVVHLAKPLSEDGLGARVAVVNVRLGIFFHCPALKPQFRGCNSTPVTSPHLYSPGTTLDTHTATLYLSHLFPQAPLFGVGFSLGAAVMTRYLGEQGPNSLIEAACVLCAPLDLPGMSYKSVHQFLPPHSFPC
jgi:predicted alpha/beta-fold hydrolase